MPRSIAPKVTIEETQARFEEWRRTRQGRAAIPDGLWALAMELARRDGVGRTAMALHLDGSKLKQRMLAAGLIQEKSTAPSFLELVAPLQSTVFALERLRCNACGEVFTAEEPAAAAGDKYDATAVAMIALLKYGTGVPFKRLERLEDQLAMPLPTTTQWELVEAAGRLLRPIWDELVRQAAQGNVLHNGDTSMRILRLLREPDDKRTGVFTSGIVSILSTHRIALFFTGAKHAGENIAEVLKQRAQELPVPIQMCDALSRNTPKLPGVKVLTANCLAHGRRQLVEVAENFQKSAAMYWRRWAKCFITTRSHENRNCRRKTGCNSISSIVGR